MHLKRPPVDRGAAAVEFAFVVVPMLFLLLAVVWGGIIFMHQASVSSAAREGARMMAITNEQGDAIDAIDAGYPFATLTSANVTFSGACPSPPDRMTSVEVEVAVDPGFTLGVFPSPTLRGVGAMRCGG